MRQLVADLSESEIQVIDLAGIGAEGISYITAPVFAPSGEVALELSIAGLPPHLTPDETERFIERLRAAAAIVTAETHGRFPPADGATKPAPRARRPRQAATGT